MPPKAESASASRAVTKASAMRRAGRHAARIGVLDHGRGRLVELQHQPRRRVEVEQVGIGELLALHDHGRAETGAVAHRVPRRRLMGILAVAQVAHPGGLDDEAGGGQRQRDARR